MESQGSMILVTSNDTRGKKLPENESSKVTSEPIIFNESPHLKQNATIQKGGAMTSQIKKKDKIAGVNIRTSQNTMDEAGESKSEAFFETQSHIKDYLEKLEDIT